MRRLLQLRKLHQNGQEGKGGGGSCPCGPCDLMRALLCFFGESVRSVVVGVGTGVGVGVGHAGASVAGSGRDAAIAITYCGASLPTEGWMTQDKPALSLDISPFLFFSRASVQTRWRSMEAGAMQGGRNHEVVEMPQVCSVRPLLCVSLFFLFLLTHVWLCC